MAFKTLQTCLHEMCMTFRGSLLKTVADKLFILSLKSELMAFKNLADMSSRNVYDFSYEQKAVVWLCVVYPLLFDWNKCCFVLNKSKEEMSFTSLPMQHKPNESVYIGNEFNSHRVALVHKHVLHFIVSEVKMPCSCNPKAKVIQSRVRKQNNCPSFGTKSMLSRIPTEQTWLVSIYTVSINMHCRLLTADYRLWTGYKTQNYV